MINSTRKSLKKRSAKRSKMERVIEIMKLVAILYDDNGRPLTQITAENRDFAPHVIKWRGSYFASHGHIESDNEMTVTYHHCEFEDFSSIETKQ